MKVVITAANSAVGQAILRRANADRSTGDTFVAAVRSEKAAEEIRELLGDACQSVRISYDDPASLDAAFQGAAAVIHLAGLLVERPGSTYEQANVETARNVVEAAKRAAVKKFVLVSATGANATSKNRYYRTKGLAEGLVRDSGLCYTVLRAPLLLGPETEGATALTRNAGRAKAMLIGGGKNFQQPLHVDDLARGTVSAARPDAASNLTLDFIGPVAITERELVERAGRLLGHEVRVGSIPKGLLSFVLSIRQKFAGPGFSPDAIEVITADTRLDPQPAAAALGIDLTGLDEMIKSSLPQERIQGQN